MSVHVEELKVGAVVANVAEDDALNEIANIASKANAIASLVVGHLKILVEGGFDINLANAMASALHAHLLGLGPVWSFDDDDVDLWPDGEDEDK